jgi:8-oxo-dGTP diphosphatase
VHEFLGVISYLGGNGPKIAHFWRMHATGGPVRKLMGDIKAVQWLPLSEAIDRLSLPHEQSFLRNVGRHALRSAVARTPVRRPVRALARPPLDQAPPVSPADGAAPRSQPRWAVLTRLTKRLQAALNPMR